MKILWSGPNVSEWALEHRPGDAAAAKWSYGLMTGLSRFAELSAVTQVRERCWPKGDVLWRWHDARLHPSEWPCRSVPYPCLYKVRDFWTRFAYPVVARRMMDEERFDAVLLYNSLYPHQVSVMKEAAKRGMPSFPIILDGDDPRKDNWAKIVADTRFAKGVVFLSSWAAENYPVQKPVLHMDGAADRFNGLPPDGRGPSWRPTFVHTGALDKWRGLRFMDAVTHRLAEVRPDIRIVLCGKLTTEERAHFDGLDNVEYRGFVTEQELSEICRKADGFLNVRDPDVGDNILNYPSKVPQYLSWGRPIISTWIDSFSKDYRDVLCVNDDNTPESFVRKVVEVCGWGDGERLAHFNKVKTWFEWNKLWPVQAKRLYEWIQHWA